MRLASAAKQEASDAEITRGGHGMTGAEVEQGSLNEEERRPAGRHPVLFLRECLRLDHVSRPGRISLVAAVACLTIPAAVLANGFGPSTDAECTQDSMCFADNDNHKFFNDESMPTDWVEAANHAQNEQLDQTTQIETSIASSHGAADVVSYQDNYGSNNLLGWVNCLDQVSGQTRKCEHWHAKFNSYYGAYTDDQKYSIACHEFGHTVGLHHYSVHQEPDQTCMETPHFHKVYNDHDRMHVNDHY